MSFEESAGHAQARVSPPLSIQQEHRLLFELAVPNCGSFNVQLAFIIRRAVNSELLSQILDDFTSEHEAFRTVVRRTAATPNQDTVKKIYAFLESGLFEQAVVPPSQCDPIRLQAKETGTHELNDLIVRRCAEGINSKFVYGNAPLLRADLFRANNGDHALLLGIPHLICDEISTHILRQRLRQEYNWSSERPAAECKALPMQYRAFACAQRERITMGLLDTELRFWKENWTRYADAQLKFAELPFARTGERTQSEFAGREMSDMSGSDYERLMAFVRARRVTLYVALRTAFHTLLSSYSSKAVTAFWGNLANRVRPESASVFGWIANRHLLGADLAGDPTVADALGLVRSTVLKELSHQEVPFPAVEMAFLREGVRITPRPPSELFLRFDVVSNARTADSNCQLLEEVGLPAVTCEGINILVIPLPGMLLFEATFNTQRFNGPDIRKVLLKFNEILRQMVSGPDERVASVLKRIGLCDETT